MSAAPDTPARPARASRTRLPRLWRSEGAAAALLVWVAVALALAVLDPYWVSVVAMMLVWCYLSTAWNLIGGYVANMMAVPYR